MATPKLPGGMTPGALPSFSFSPMAHMNSPASHLLHKNRSSPASSLPFGTSPNSLPAAFSSFMRDHSGYPLPPDESKRREWDEVIRLLSARRGRISQTGIKRLAEAAGLHVWVEDTKEGQQITLSKDYAVIDIYLSGTEIKKVACTMANTIGPMVDLAGRAGKVLLVDLTPSTVSPAERINSSLDAFSSNLERLANLDKLSGISKINIFAALGGLYDSLRKVYELQIAARDEIFAANYGLGKPGMHSGGKIGLSVEYWKERHGISTNKRHHRTKDEMELDEEEDIKDDPTRKTFRVLIEARELQSGFAAPLPLLRNSSNWITADGEPLLSPEQIPWADPDAMPLEEGATPVIFVLRLSPGVLLPPEEEAALYAAAGMASGSETEFSTLDHALFGLPQHDLADMEAERDLWTPEGERKQFWKLKKLKISWMKEVKEIPFGHPRELVGVFSVLRQHLLFQTLLSSVLNPSTLKKEPTHDKRHSAQLHKPASPAQVPFDITFSHLPPFIRTIIPEPELITLQIDILRNAEIQVQVETGAYTPEGPKRLTAIGEKVRRIVEGTCDLGIVVEVVKKLMKEQ